MDETTPAPPPSAPGWEARPTIGGRWGILHRPTDQWVAFGDEAQCRALAAHLTEVGAPLSRRAPVGPDAGGPAA